MSIRLEIVLIKLESTSNKQFNPFRSALRKKLYPLRKNVAIWEYPTGKGLTVCQVQKAESHPFVHRNSFLKVAGKVAVAQITCRSVLLENRSEFNGIRSMQSTIYDRVLSINRNC